MWGITKAPFMMALFLRMCRIKGLAVFAGCSPAYPGDPCAASFMGFAAF